MNQTNIFDDFKTVLAVEERLKTQYADKIPNAMMKLWNEFGFGSCMGGYLKIVNPEEHKEILTESYLQSENTIALFATNMGDLILLETGADGDTYVVMVNYRWGKTKVLASNFD
ncbi:GAD-like domain-containing protein [Listeria booriae]|nr:GAD-like domain-containing protein [Listeria booriae]